MAKSLPNPAVTYIRVDLKKGSEIDQTFDNLRMKIAKIYKKDFDSLSTSKVMRDAIIIAEKSIDAKAVEIPEEFVTNIERLTKSPSFRRKYAISDMNQFVIRALSEFIAQINKEKKSLLRHQYSILPELNSYTRQVATVLLELQGPKTEPPEFFTVNKILERMNPKTTSTEKIEQALLELVSEGYLESTVNSHNEKVYWLI